MSERPAPDYALLDRLGAAGAIFYPRDDQSPCPPGASDHRLPVPGAVLAARFYRADPAYPTVVFFHGNGEVIADYDEMARVYHGRAGTNLVVVDFRAYGQSTGRPTFATLVEDALPVAAQLHSLLDTEAFVGRRYVMGRSLGAHPALEIAANGAAGFSGLIIESGAGMLRRFLGRLSADAATGALAAAHEEKLRAITLPALLIHGERDELVPPENARELHALLASEEKELLIIPGAGHNDIAWVGMAPYFAAIKRFVHGEDARPPGT